jgi:hypothetical protein
VIDSVAVAADSIEALDAVTEALAELGEQLRIRARRQAGVGDAIRDRGSDFPCPRESSFPFVRRQVGDLADVEAGARSPWR